MLWHMWVTETRLFKTTEEISGKVNTGNRCPALKPNPETSENLQGPWLYTYFKGSPLRMRLFWVKQLSICTIRLSLFLLPWSIPPWKLAGSKEPMAGRLFGRAGPCSLLWGSRCNSLRSVSWKQEWKQFEGCASHPSLLLCSAWSKLFDSIYIIFPVGKWLPLKTGLGSLAKGGWI